MCRKDLPFYYGKSFSRNRWYDLEAFLSCSPKPLITMMLIQPNFRSVIWHRFLPARRFLFCIRRTGTEEWLEYGRMVTDYTALTQAVWNHPLIKKRPTLGGYTTQNTDGEWCDHRQDYMAVTFMEYYRLTGNMEYLETKCCCSTSRFRSLSI